MKIGIVDLDTSHPQGWIPVEREMGHEVVGVLDSGDVHPQGYADDFAARLEVPRVYTDLNELAHDVDCAIIHSCDWDTHIPKAKPFIEAGKAVLIDKPIAGNMRDIDQVRQWVNQGARITGGSSLRFCYETQQWLARDVAQRGTPHTVLCGCAVDEFNYGIHAYSMLSGILGPGIVSIRSLGKHVQRRIQVNWADGRMGIVVVGEAAQWQPFYANISTEMECAQYQPNPKMLYRALLASTMDYLSGKTDNPPLPFDELIEPELAAIAAQESWNHNSREIMIAEIGEDTAGYNGREFADFYRKQKYPDSK